VVRPPVAAEWLLRRALRSAVEREMVLGDLCEQLPRHDAAWYWRQAFAISAHAITQGSPSGGGPALPGDFFMYSLMTDVRYAWRGLFKRPCLTLTVTATLALGLGANAAIFSVIDKMVLRPYPLVDPDRTVLLAETGPRLEYRKESVSRANFLDWRTSDST
jgi:hypothetical protein